MFLFRKRVWAILLAALAFICTACNSNKLENNNDNNYSNDVVVNSSDNIDVNDDMAPSDEEKVEIKVGLVKNSASVLGAAHLFANSEDNSAYEKYTPVVYNTADELLLAFNNGEVATAVLPPDKAAICYDKSNCYVTAITGGCNYYIAENGNTINDITDLNGKTVTVSKEDTMSQSVLNVVAKNTGINISYNQVENNKALVEGIKNGSVKCAMMQEPYLSQVTNDSVRSAIDLYDSWNDVAEQEMVTSCLIVNRNFVSEQAVPFGFFMKDYSASASMARRNTEETAKVANKFALVDDVDACKAAVPGCGVTFKTGAEMQEMLTAFYNQIFAENANILGGQVPDSSFYFVNE